jgi:hypothetical protein
MASSPVPRHLSVKEIRKWLADECSQDSPVGDEAGSKLDLVTLREGGMGGGSIASLRVLDLARVIKLAASAPIATAVAVFGNQLATPLSIVLGVLSLVSSVHTAVTTELAERHATVLWTLWVHREVPSNLVKKEGLLKRVNVELASYKASSITEGELEVSLVFLRRYRCISDRGALLHISQIVRIT